MSASTTNALEVWRAAWDESRRLVHEYAVAAHAGGFYSPEAVALRREWRASQERQMRLFDQLTEEERADARSAS